MMKVEWGLLEYPGPDKNFVARLWVETGLRIFRD